MFSRKRNIQRLTSIMLAVFLGVALLAPIAQARASNYLASYGASMIADGNGKVSVWFDVTGVGRMEEIGSVSMSLYENGKFIKSYSYSTTPSMMGYDKSFYSGSVTYQGVAGRSYYTIVYFWAARNGGGDTRSRTTTTIIAT